MWTTADGFVLRVPGFRLLELARSRKLGSRPCCTCEGCLGRAVEEMEGELGELVGRARRAGSARGKKSGRRMQIFSATRGRRRYRIFTRPLFGRQHTIVAVAPQPIEPPADVIESAPVDAPEEPADAGSAPPEEPAGAEAVGAELFHDLGPLT